MFCTKCGNQLEEAAMFCAKCGARCAAVDFETAEDILENDYSDYWGMNYNDFETGRTIELTPIGVRIFKDQGLKFVQYDRIIPYDEIIDIVYRRATNVQRGYLSIVTVTEGVMQKVSIQKLRMDKNSVLFKKKYDGEVDRIYDALQRLWENPPNTTNHSRNIEYKSKPSVSAIENRKLRKKLIILCVSVSVCIIPLLIYTFPDTPTAENPAATQEEPQEVRPQDYELSVFNTFWEGTSERLGLEYSDYKWTRTSTSYISDFQTSDGYTVHFYRIETAFETENIFGKKIVHPVEARCYYIPDKNTVYTPYVTLDGEVIAYNEEQESWLMGMA